MHFCLGVIHDVDKNIHDVLLPFRNKGYFDLYLISGRYNHVLKLKSDVKPLDISADLNVLDNFLIEKGFEASQDEDGVVCRAKLKDIDVEFHEKNKVIFCSVITPDGIWHDCGCEKELLNDEVNDAVIAWQKKYINWLKTSNQEMVLTIIDCHI